MYMLNKRGSLRSRISEIKFWTPKRPEQKLQPACNTTNSGNANGNILGLLINKKQKDHASVDRNSLSGATVDISTSVYDTKC